MFGRVSAAMRPDELIRLESIVSDVRRAKSNKCQVLATFVSDWSQQ